MLRFAVMIILVSISRCITRRSRGGRRGGRRRLQRRRRVGVCGRGGAVRELPAHGRRGGFPGGGGGGQDGRGGRGLVRVGAPPLRWSLCGGGVAAAAAEVHGVDEVREVAGEAGGQLDDVLRRPRLLLYLGISAKFKCHLKSVLQMLQ